MLLIVICGKSNCNGQELIYLPSSTSILIECIGTMCDDSVKSSSNEEFYRLTNKICHTIILGISMQNVLTCRKDWSGEELEWIDPVCLMFYLYVFICLFIRCQSQMLSKSERRKKQIRRIIRFNWANTNYQLACVMLVNLKLAHLHQN